MTLYRIEYKRLADTDWTDAGDEPQTREQAEAWMAQYQRGVEGIYEYRIVSVSGNSAGVLDRSGLIDSRPLRHIP